MVNLQPDILCSVPPVELMLPSLETAASGKNRRTGMDLLRPHQATQGLSLSGKKKYLCVKVKLKRLRNPEEEYPGVIVCLGQQIETEPHTHWRNKS